MIVIIGWILGFMVSVFDYGVSGWVWIMVGDNCVVFLDDILFL